MKVRYSDPVCIWCLTSINLHFVFVFSDYFEDYIWDHPVELKKLLVGDLANEMTVKVKRCVLLKLSKNTWLFY